MSEHPQVVERLTRFYEDWWAELEPTFAQSTAIYLGHPYDNPARLTSHDWITTRSTPWNQSHVRAAQNGSGNTGFWNVKVTEAGKYRIRLRRWPEEADLAINASLAPGAAVPGAKAYRETPGKAISPVRATLRIGDKMAERPVPQDAKEVVFEIELAAETTTMAATFQNAKGVVYGAYFAYVEKL